MPTSAAAAARTSERIKRESQTFRNKRDSILSVISNRPIKTDSNLIIQECFGTSSRCERGTTVLEEHGTEKFQPRLLLKYTALGLSITALPFLIAPLVAILTENGEAGIITTMFGVLIGLTVLLLVFCSLQIWKVEMIPTVVLLSYGALISLGTLGTTLASLHYIPSGKMYTRILYCADPTENTGIRNCAGMQSYLDIMTVAQCFIMLGSFAAFMDSCLTAFQHKEGKGKGIDEEDKDHYEPPVPVAFEEPQPIPRRGSTPGVVKITRFEDETTDLDQIPEKVAEETIAGEGSSKSS